MGSFGIIHCAYQKIRSVHPKALPPPRIAGKKSLHTPGWRQRLFTVPSLPEPTRTHEQARAHEQTRAHEKERPHP